MLNHLARAYMFPTQIYTFLSQQLCSLLSIQYEANLANFLFYEALFPMSAQKVTRTFLALKPHLKKIITYLVNIFVAQSY